MTKALVIIDVQKAMWENPAYPPYDDAGVVARIADLIGRAKAAGAPVFWVQHHGQEEKHPLKPGLPGYPFHDAVAPGPDDNVTVKTKSSAFHDTDFDAKLKTAGVDHIVVTGMQSEFCVNSAIRGAYERGYKITLVSDAHSTGDTPMAKAGTIVALQNFISQDFGAVKPAAEVSF
ncbi:MAG TPA: cysteine hydrolase family protein [Rhizomicrobium sp.]|jgi:nicotinamidase-related amidase|nr:cysteine hydrolase family protein [Rhizomicrobium sp.]